MCVIISPNALQFRNLSINERVGWHVIIQLYDVYIIHIHICNTHVYTYTCIIRVSYGLLDVDCVVVSNVVLYGVVGRSHVEM